MIAELLHILWISLKGLMVYAVIGGSTVGVILLFFGTDLRSSEAIPGIIGGGILMFATVFVALMVLLPMGGRP